MPISRFERATRLGLEQAGRVAVAATDLRTRARTGTGSRSGDRSAPTAAPGPVVLVGGFAATGPVLDPMAARLRARGHDVLPVTTGAGLGCAGRAAEALADRVIETAERTGAPVQVVGHSRGGQFARVAAARADVRAGAHVAGLVTLGAPFDLYGLRWPTLAQAAAVSAAGSLGVPGLATLACLRGGCCAAFRAGLRAPWPRDVPFTSIYSRSDRAVPWRSSHDPHARNVEVAGGHLALLTAPPAFREVCAALTRSAVEPRRPAFAV
ncbi:esterase/lipase family protein [Actinomycetospora sp. CA-101289]|uniref:esterase/lipase family protein n=1 Tax=Actinomycetospora sp. CA-101289 TaxID=3239893 RepID=UPI003D977CCE